MALKESAIWPANGTLGYMIEVVSRYVIGNVKQGVGKNIYLALLI